MNNRYSHPPIKEAVCEFRFGKDTTWDLAVPGLVYERVRKIFPKRETLKTLSMDWEPRPDGLSQRVQTADRTKFMREDELAFIQIEPRLLAINHLEPYPSWDEFLPLVTKGLEAYNEVVTPKTIQRIGLRYINRVDFSEDKIAVEDYFSFRPFIGKELDKDITSFIAGIEIAQEAKRDSLRLTLASAASETGTGISIILDLDYYLVNPQVFELAGVYSWINTAHESIETAFEDCITDKLRNRF